MCGRFIRYAENRLAQSNDLNQIFISMVYGVARGLKLDQKYHLSSFRCKKDYSVDSGSLFIGKYRSGLASAARKWRNKNALKIIGFGSGRPQGA